MKRLLISLAAAAVLLPAMAQTTVNPNAKVDPKNNKVSKPVVEKAKPKPQLTRDQLRSCMDRSDANNVEADKIKGLQDKYKADSAALKQEKADMQKQEEANAAQLAAAKEERTAIEKFGADLTANGSKLPKDELEAKKKEYQTRAAAFDATAKQVSEANNAMNARREAFNARIPALEALFKEMDDRTEEHSDKINAWKTECSNKTFEEADEIAIKKERAAAGKQ
ncbi:hypothetical protein [Pelomonas sp. KK5]|uniref:hypothetical protein n=1 Tax=Pelomonas sp. KK5 TaxID=1855730 RepID=UPI00097C31A4|nr:hypothetical protein [Pelomonas sp. KK5]